MSKPELKIWSAKELTEWCDSEEKRRRALPLIDLDHYDGFIFNEEYQGFEIYWGGYEYFIELDRIDSPLILLQWIQHITEKEWEGITGEHLHHFIAAVFQRQEWELYPSSSKEKKSAQQARNAMTPALRYEVLSRDNHRCKKCGLTVALGAVLHVDHIVPVSKGGQTIKSNLQTLCANCNFGKRNRNEYD